MDNVEQAKNTLQKITYICMATVNKDGSPHNSPLVFLYDEHLKYIYWGSHPESQHSQNVLRTGQAFFVAFDSVNRDVGVYIRATEGHIVEGEDLMIALRVHNHFREKMGKDQLSVAYYSGNNPQRMWRAKVDQVWINAYQRRTDGKLIKDYKIELKPGSIMDLWK